MYEFVITGNAVSASDLKYYVRSGDINNNEDFVYYVEADTEIPYTGAEVLQMIKDGTL